MGGIWNTLLIGTVNFNYSEYFLLKVYNTLF